MPKWSIANVIKDNDDGSISLSLYQQSTGNPTTDDNVRQ
eukprot:CAMPEP_0194118126 /NCGR_PEP_ID=MMETSP0150-20130528/34231_1 /TAXON_ID=122233 /ORGANISM="Chaetoceros debilis, Strain MM31A-1" /LENGTH=38 /DNA_ID= /DNA_START= /DNA_END= /DNA_ORIENTATION=